MNQVAHLYLLPRGGASVPGRWAEAFPKGQAVVEKDLAKRLAVGEPGLTTLWVSTDLPGWPERVQALSANARVVVLSGAPERDEGLQAMEAGARGYAHAYAVAALLQELAVVVAHGGLWLGPEVLQHLITRTHDALRLRPAPASRPAAGGALASAWSRLTSREVEVARAVAQGRSNKEVADLMFISERTVKAHLGSIFDKLGVRDRLQLVLQMAAVAESAPPSSEPAA